MDLCDVKERVDMRPCNVLCFKYTLKRLVSSWKTLIFHKESADPGWVSCIF